MDVDEARQLITLIRKLTRTMAGAFDRQLHTYHLTLSQWAILRQLWEQEGRSQVELQHRLSLEGATVTGLLQRMARAGLIQRQPDQFDKRVQRVFLTDHGRALQPIVVQLGETINAQALDGFTADEKAFLMRLLLRALHNFERDE